MKIEIARTFASCLARASGMWLFALAIGVFVTVSAGDWTFGLIASFGLCVAAAVAFSFSDKLR